MVAVVATCRPTPFLGHLDLRNVRVNCHRRGRQKKIPSTMDEQAAAAAAAAAAVAAAAAAAVSVTTTVVSLVLLLPKMTQVVVLSTMTQVAVLSTTAIDVVVWLATATGTTGWKKTTTMIVTVHRRVKVLVDVIATIRFGDENVLELKVKSAADPDIPTPPTLKKENSAVIGDGPPASIL